MGAFLALSGDAVIWIDWQRKRDTRWIFRHRQVHKGGENSVVCAAL